MKGSQELVFIGVGVEKNFNQGKSNRENVETKKKVGRRSVKKARVIARKTRIEGLGEKGISDAYKEYKEADSESVGIFRFENISIGETHSGKCNINIEEVKGVGELIGVSWSRTEDEKKMEERGKIEAE
ncbi:hypothetical protein Tco_1100210, partial [Tanacetum coccineum]